MFLWITGQSGAGKTTLGTLLAERHGFAHFDGDVYFCGGDPVEEAGKFIGSDRASEELKEQWSVVVKNYEALFDGREVPTEEWTPALGGLCRAAASAARGHPRLVVTFSLYTRAVRRWVEDQLVEHTPDCGDREGSDDRRRVQFVVLNDADGAAAKRKLEQVKAAAASQGKTMEEFVAQYGKEYKGEEHTLRELSRSQRGFEAGVENEGEIDLRVAETDDAEAVLSMVVRRLRLKDE